MLWKKVGDLIIVFIIGGINVEKKMLSDSNDYYQNSSYLLTLLYASTVRTPKFGITPFGLKSLDIRSFGIIS